MKSRIVVLLLSLVLVSSSGCGAEVESVDYSEKSMFVEIEKAGTWRIVYHKETKVMYAISSGGHNFGTFTVLVNPDGTPMIYGEDLE